MDHGQELPQGSRLEEFVIERTLGVGGFGITYLALDTSLGRKVVVKEHLPDAFSFRDVAAMTVRPRHSSGEMLENYQWALDSFLREAEMLAALDHPNIVRVLRRFEGNGTAYFVMPFVEGESFDKVIEHRQKDGGHFTESQLHALLEALLNAFTYLHGQGVHHRDVKPGNILLTADKRPVLIDFGAARQHLGQKSMTVIESAGYTPFEQTESRGNIGPWSDLYALGGVLRKAITFETPARSADRIRRDPMTDLASDPAWNQRYSMRFLQSVDRALRVNEEDRWQDGAQWLDHLREQPNETAESKPGAARQPEPQGVATSSVNSAKVADDRDPSSLASRGPKLRMPPAGVSHPETKATPLPGNRSNRSLKRKKRSKACLAVTLVILVGTAGFGGWRMMQARDSDTDNGVTSEFLQPTEAFADASAEPVEPEPIRVPNKSEWKSLAGQDDPFACALLGEALLTGDAGMAKDPTKAMSLLATSAEAGHPLGTFLFAEARRSEGEDSSGFEEAIELGLETRANEGGPVWQAAIGRAYLRGTGTDPNPKEAFDWLKSAADAGHASSQQLVSEMLGAGLGTTVNARESLRYLEKAAESGRTEAIIHTARLYHSGPPTLRNPSKALVWAREAAKSGDPVSMGLLGDLLESGAAVTRKPAEALHWYRQAAEKEDAFSMGRLGIFLMNGTACEQNEKEAFNWLRKSVELNDKQSFFPLGSLYETGDGGIKDPVRAVALYRSGAEAGDVDAIEALARCAEQGVGMMKNTAEAARLYAMATEKGSHEAGFRLGMLMLDGRGISKDETEAFRLIRNAAEEGNSEAIFQMARCLETGLGTDRDEASAIRAYRDAAEDDLPEACFRLAVMLEEGRGASKDEAGAAKWYRVAADTGHIGAQVNLGILHSQGRGVKQDDEAALEWYAKAAEHQDEDALVLLGMMHQFGIGTQRSSKEAAKFYKKAADQGDAEAKELLEKLSQ